MTFQERHDQGPEDAPSPERVRRLAFELWAAGELPDGLHAVSEPITVADRERFLALADARIRDGAELRVRCRGWGDSPVHAKPIILRAGLEPVSDTMCPDCARAFDAEAEAVATGAKR